MGRYLSIFYWINVHQLLVTVCPCVVWCLCLLPIPYNLGILHYWIQFVRYCWVGIFPYVIGLVFINCWLLSVVCCWLVYVHALLVTVYSILPMLSSFLDTGCLLFLGLFICYWVCAQQLLVLSVYLLLVVYVLTLLVTVCPLL